MPCCPCMGSTGRCLRCKCVTAGRKCRDCRPSRCNPSHCKNQDSANQSIPQIDEPMMSLSKEDSINHSTDNYNELDHFNCSSDSLEISDPNAVDNAPIPHVGNLPHYKESNPPNFMWGDIDGDTFTSLISEAYNKVVHWRRNIFRVPSGKAGKSFVNELSRLLESYSDGNALECIALKASMVLPCLVLQKPHPKSSCKEHTVCLSKRLSSWASGDIKSLLHECRTIQSRLPQHHRMNSKDGSLSRSFQKLMNLGNVKAAMRLITESDTNGPLSLDDQLDDGRTVKEHLLDKHPIGKPAHPSSISDMQPVTPPHPVLFDGLDGPLIRSIALRLSGSAGPSGLDSRGWKRICCSFHRPSENLCSAIAKVARKLCTTFVDPNEISALVSCRLIALPKSSGVRPIGVGEVLRRIIAKAILKFTKNDVQNTVGCLQLCARQHAGSEAGVHAMR